MCGEKDSAKRAQKVETYEVCNDEVDDLGLELRVIEAQLREQLERSLLK